MKKTIFLLLLIIPLLFSCTNRVHGRYKKENGNLCIYGIAEDAKAGAIVSTANMGMFYIDKKSHWNEDILGKEIIVLGKLRTIDHGLENSQSQKIMGIQRIIIHPKWKLAQDTTWRITP